MRILYLCHRFPYPPTRGGKIRPFNMIRHWSQQHEVHVMSLAHSQQDLDDAPGIAPYCASHTVAFPGKAARWARMLARVPTVHPSALGYFLSPELQRCIDNKLQSARFDLIFVHCAFVAAYVANIEGPTKILDFGDMDSQKWLAYADAYRFPRSAAYLIEGRKMERFEAWLAARFDCCTATTRLEHDTLASMGTARRTGWFPNGVDSTRFAPAEAGAQYDPNTVVFVGRMDYFPNQLAVQYFATQVMPLIRAGRRDAIFRIVGAEPPESIRQLAQLDGVEVTGTVPDVRDLVRNAALTVAPLSIARGTQNKVLESMALGVPVIASAAASRGVDAEANEHLLVAESAREYADQSLSLMNDRALRATLSEQARLRVLQRHDWAASMQLLDGIVHETIDHRRQ
jgi:sugar transferase (PEP-CTERM/EpsH1 system associated)